VKDKNCVSRFLLVMSHDIPFHSHKLSKNIHMMFSPHNTSLIQSRCHVTQFYVCNETEHNKLNKVLFNLIILCNIIIYLRYATNQKVAGSIPDEVKFEIYLILPVALGPGVYSASNRNECGWCVRLTSMSRLSRQCAILNISQPYRPPRPVTG
jgi:hypothetical protein